MSVPKQGKKDEVKRLILEWLKSGRYQSGEKLPSEPELVKLLGCGRSTIREATGLLVNEGYLSRVGGSGTYVTPGKRPYTTIAVLVPALYSKSNHTLVEVPIVASIEEEARQHGAGILLYACNHVVDKERENLLDVIGRQVDGAIVFPIFGDQNTVYLEAVRNAGIPIALVDRYVEKLDLDYVVTDNYGGIYDAVKSITEMGILNIYYISTTESGTSVRDRMLGYTDAVNALGLSCNIILANTPAPKATVDRDSSEYVCLRRSLECMRLPAALFSMNAAANPFVREVIEDLCIPHDQIVLGHFDFEKPSVVHDMCYFEVDQPFAEVGAKAVQIIMDRLAGGKERHQVALKPQLTVHNLSAFAGLPGNTDALTFSGSLKK